MKQGIFTIKDNKSLTPTTYLMKLEGDTSAVTAPGQFINIRLDGHFLRRPISVNDADDSTITIIYKVLGHGTEEMTHFAPGKELDVLTGLGNGYDLSTSGDRPLLIGGGVGIPPLYLAAKKLIAAGRDADGSAGVRGFVTDAFRELTSMCGSPCLEEAGLEPDADAEFIRFSHFYTCGPEPMLRAVYDEVYTGAGISGQMSFEERMGCGFGACMGCSIRTAGGYKRICKDGPVLRTEEILW